MRPKNEKLAHRLITMKEELEKLPPEKFRRILRSYIVPLAYELEFET